jgi:hypothetical protein
MELLYFWAGMVALTIIFSIIRWIVQKIRLAAADTKCLRLLRELEPQLYELETKSIEKAFLNLKSEADAFFERLEREYPLPKREPERTVDHYIQAERRHLRHRE